MPEEQYQGELYKIWRYIENSIQVNDAEGKLK